MMFERFSKKNATPVVPKDYYDMARTWDHDIYQKAHRSKRRAWMLAAGCFGLALLSMLALVLILPLKQVTPIFFTVDRATGRVDATTGVAPGQLAEDEVVAMSDIARYVTLRETYDVSDIESNFRDVVLMSTPQEARPYQDLLTGKSPDNPITRLGDAGKVFISIKNVSLLNKEVAQVRFDTTERKSNAVETKHWVAIVGFRYVQSPKDFKDLLKNPLGFQVTSYRRDQEIEPTVETQP
jgi:type IV secretion system protein VirB8